jgi:hypothetical protein
MSKTESDLGQIRTDHRCLLDLTLRHDGITSTTPCEAQFGGIPVLRYSGSTIMSDFPTNKYIQHTAPAGSRNFESRWVGVKEDAHCELSQGDSIQSRCRGSNAVPDLFKNNRGNAVFMLVSVGVAFLHVANFVWCTRVPILCLHERS